MLEIIITCNIILFALMVFVVRMNIKFINTIKNYQKKHDLKIDDINRWLNKIVLKIDDIDLLNVKFLEKDFNFISSLSKDSMHSCLSRYPVRNHIEDVIKFIISNSNYELNMVLIKYLYDNLGDKKHNINDKKLLNLFYKYGEFMASTDDKKDPVFKMIKVILQNCNFFTHEETL